MIQRYVYATPIFNGKSEILFDYFQKKKKNEEQLHLSFWEPMKMVNWRGWIQHLRGQDYLIHYLEATGPFNLIFDALREHIRQKHPLALSLQKLYIECLGVDYASPDFYPQIEQVASHTLSTTSLPTKQKCFLFPLLPEHVETHKEYCKNTETKNFEVTKNSCAAFGVTKMMKWIQKTTDGYYLTYYQELIAEKDHFVTSDNSSYQLIRSFLQKHTGLNQKELYPLTKELTSTQHLIYEHA